MPTTWVKNKIKKILREGVRGKPVSQKQAVAIALSMAREKGIKTRKKGAKGRIVVHKGKVVYGKT